MAASQSRMLSLTSRLSDLELRAQQISNAKIRLADASSEASNSYNLALDRQQLTVFTGVSTNGVSNYAQATLNNLLGAHASATDIFRYIETADGKAVINSDLLAKYNAATGTGAARKADFIADCGGSTDTTSQSYQYYSKLYDKIAQGANSGYYLPTNSEQGSNSWLNSQIEAGLLYLSEWKADGGSDGKGAFEGVSWSSGDSTLISKTDDTAVAKAEAEYERTQKEVQSKEARLDMELKQIDTEHNAVQTEIDSVKGVIQKNIERSFKIFDA